MKRDEYPLDSNWTYLFTYVYTLDIYAYDCLRIGIDRDIGKQRIGYVKNG